MVCLGHGRGLFLWGSALAYGSVALVALAAAGCSEGSKRSDAGNASGNGAAALPDSGASGGAGLEAGGSSFDAGAGAAVDAATPSDAAVASDASSEDVPNDAAPPAAAKGHWVSLGAPQAPLIGAFALDDDDTLFAGTGSPNGGLTTGGMFSTSDGGNAWRFTSNGLTGSDTSSMAVASSGLFAAIGYVLFRSQDHGVTWQGTGATGRAIAAQGNLVVVADPYYAISTDGGQTFVKESASKGTNSDDVAVVGNIVLRVTAGVLTRSSDQGGSFGPVQAPPDSQFTNVSLKCDRTKICYALAYKTASESSLYRSADAGATWADLGHGVFAILAVTDEGSVYVRNSSGTIERSDDSGTTWQACPEPATDSSCIKTVLSARRDRVFASCAAGVYRSDDRGGHWALAVGSQATGALTDVATMVFVDRTDAAHGPSGDLYVGAPPGRAGNLLSSSDDGKSWKATNPIASSACAESDKHTLICSGSSLISRSDDQGATWTRIEVDPLRSGTVVAAGPSGFYLAGDGKQGVVWRSDDDGRSFALVGSAPYTTGLQVLKSGHLLRQGGRIGKSEDRGETWTDAGWLVNTLPVPEDAEGRLYIGSVGKLMVSSDEGNSWQPMADVPPNPALVNSAFLTRDSQGRFYLNGPNSTNPRVIYFNDPASSSWETFPVPPSPNIRQFAFDKRDRLLAATNAGLYRFESE